VGRRECWGLPRLRYGEESRGDSALIRIVPVHVMPRPAPRRVRKRVFGRDPATYDRARLDYPPRVYDLLRKRCGLRPGSSVFEIGPGTGIATRSLLKFGANPIVLIEPDRRLARYLAARLPESNGRVRIFPGPFEKVRLPRG